MAALEANDADKAAAVCADVRPPRSRREGRGERRHSAWTDALPGHFANYTTWTFETDGDLITHVTFTWRPAN